MGQVAGLTEMHSRLAVVANSGMGVGQIRVQRGARSGEAGFHRIKSRIQIVDRIGVAESRQCATAPPGQMDGIQHHVRQFWVYRITGQRVLGGLEWLNSEGRNVRIALGVGSPTAKVSA